MKTTTPAKRDMQEMTATGRDTRTAVLTRSIRANVPLRKTFVQANKGAASRHGPLKDFVTGRDLRGLKAYLIIVAACSNGDNGNPSGLPRSTRARYDRGGCPLYSGTAMLSRLTK
ncbi:hypothetical protein ACIBB8_37675, partial [Streptomyces sp. NPDC051286]